MKTHNVLQNTEEWSELRAKHFTASEAPAMMGKSKYTSRTQLIHQKKTGESEPVSPSLQALFDKGHAAEAMARPIIEALIGEELYPVTATSDEHPKLLASFDGITMLEDIVFENKSYNNTLAENVRNGVLEEHYIWQLEQQLLVSGAEKAIFVTSDGTKENMATMWYVSQPECRQALLDGWTQFEKDLAEYVPTAKVEKIDTTPVAALPALIVDISGSVNQSTLVEFKGSALAYIANINTDLETDHDFAVAENDIKFCAKTEKDIDSIKQAALAKTEDISNLFDALDELKELLRQKRLGLNNSVKTRKDEIKQEILMDGAKALVDHIEAINQQFDNVQMPSIPTDFRAAIKGKRNIDSMRDAMNDELARAKIEANKVAGVIQDNLKSLHQEGKDFGFLFNDLTQIITKDHSDFINLIKTRITEHQQAETLRREAAERAEQARKEESEREVLSVKETPETVAEQLPTTPMPPDTVSPAAFQDSDITATITDKATLDVLQSFFTQEALSNLYQDDNGTEYDLGLALFRLGIKPSKAA